MARAARLGPSAWLAALGLLLGCGGKAVIDGSNQLGGSGGGGSGTGGTAVGGHSGTGGDGASAGACATPAPSGWFGNCAGGYLADGCYFESCDEAGHSWRATCTSAGCSCSYDSGAIGCDCQGVTAAQFCQQMQHSCCPTPFP